MSLDNIKKYFEVRRFAMDEDDYSKLMGLVDALGEGLDKKEADSNVLKDEGDKLVENGKLFDGLDKYQNGLEICPLNKLILLHRAGVYGQISKKLKNCDNCICGDKPKEEAKKFEYKSFYDLVEDKKLCYHQKVNLFNKCAINDSIRGLHVDPFDARFYVKLIEIHEDDSKAQEYYLREGLRIAPENDELMKLKEIILKE
ncbi:hypothetical protein ECANGB1_733 [Enterospora canceri]|uniref:Uncharacterized protein n=1 Tax=Enterospora canceri TaxID=1081671 RepID=A0A1Y1S8A5_9MICR|nr:hypothetical protein ECANGB1_733 [Enterospora canceri]